MQYFVVLAVIAAVASAAVIKPAVVAGELAQIQEIVAAINHPSTDPGTVALLEQLLYETLGLPAASPVVVGPAIVDSFEPIAVGPVIVDSFEPIAVGPVVVDEFEPVAVGPAIIPPVVVDPSPVEEIPAVVIAPLVQIIVNVNSAADVPAVNPAAPETIIDVPHPVQVVDVAPVVPEPVQVVDVAPIVPEPVQVVDLVPEPVQVVEPVLPVLPEPVVIPEPILPEPVQVAEPVIPVDPAITLPEELN